MAFEKGQSGNPGGRPKEDPEVKSLAKANSTMALERLIFWAKTENPKASVAACIHILDRAYGKPAQQLDINKADPFDNLSLDELIAIGNALSIRLASIAPEAAASDGTKDA